MLSDRLWRVGLCGLLLLGLSACGFQLRGNQTFAFKTLYVDFALSSGLRPEFVRQVDLNGQLRLLRDPRQRSEADVVLEILSEGVEKMVVASSVAGQVREFELRARLRFRLRNAQGKELIGESEIVQSRALSYNETYALAKEAEEQLLYKEMYADIANQLLYRLSAVKAF